MYKGAQYEKYITEVDENLIERYQDILKIITIAPEVPGALNLIDNYREKINFSMGHSGADYELAKKALAKGAKSVTHLFNCMSPLHHRNLGVVGSALTSDCYCELIEIIFM